MRFTAAMAGAFGAALAAGCTALHSSQEATQVYTLEVPVPASAAVPAAADKPIATGLNEARPTLQVLRPIAAPGLDSERIAVVRNVSQLDYYAASRWPAPLPEVLQSLAVSALRASGQFRAVQSEGAAFAADEVLQLEIRRCQAEYNGGGDAVVRVQLVATLGRRADRSLVASVSAESVAPVAENRLQAVIAAYRSAVGEALGQLVTQLP
ncbi:MAG TPA: ABC-type transport auxiliary lipoprotein family protein [Steroidobacteraceae bacterium]